MRPSNQEIFERLWEDENTWQDFVDDWIERNPDAVHDVIDDYLRDKLNESKTSVNDDYVEFVNKAVESEISDYEDRKYDEWRDSR